MDIKNIPFETPEAFNVLIEIQKGSGLKYEYDEELEVLKLDWIFTDNFVFPENYGLIPGTRGGDGDHLDAFVVSHEVLYSGTLVQCRALGMIEMIDRGENDDKIIAVPLKDKTAGEWRSLKDLPYNAIDLFTSFFSELARQKNKSVIIKGFHSAERAAQMIEHAARQY